MRRFFSIVLLVLLVVVAVPVRAHADANNFTVTYFSVDYYLTRNDPQGALAVQEHIEVTFNDYNHGITRALPKDYNGRPLHIAVQSVSRDGSPEPYSTYTSNGNEVLKVGNPNNVITGAHTYDIDYQVVHVMRFLGNHDELDWNVNGTGWGQPFNHIVARLHVPPALVNKLSDVACYTGQQGSMASNCAVSQTQDGAMFSTYQTLSAGETLSFKVGVPIGYFVKPTFRDWWQDRGAQILEVSIPILLAIIIAGAWWFRNGKDLKGRGTIIPQYGPPDNLRAAEVDVINHYKLGENGVSATIIDLAIRKYIRIQETDHEGLAGIGKYKSYSFVLLPGGVSEALRPYESQVLAGLFPGGVPASDLSSLQNNFYTTAQALQKDIPNNLTLAGYFPHNPKKVGHPLHVIGILLVVAGIALLAHNGIGVLAAGIICLFFGSLMPRRTEKGVEAKDVIAGLKLYLNTAEKDRMEGLQSPNAPYGPQSNEPIKTVELFEKLLPYAMVLGVEKQWAKQFESIYISPPDWYGGTWTAFNAIYLTDSLTQSMSVMNSSFAAPSSGGAGSGGGFAGGGGGGGGGGGW